MCVCAYRIIHTYVCVWLHTHNIYIYIYVCVCVIMSMYNVCVCGLCVRAYAYFWYRLVTPSFTISRPANHTARPWLRWCNRRRLSVAFMETARSTTAFRNTMAQQRPKKDPHQRWNRPKIARSHWKKTWGNLQLQLFLLNKGSNDRGSYLEIQLLQASLSALAMARFTTCPLSNQKKSCLIRRREYKRSSFFPSFLISGSETHLAHSASEIPWATSHCPWPFATCSCCSSGLALASNASHICQSLKAIMGIHPIQRWSSNSQA